MADGAHGVATPRAQRPVELDDKQVHVAALTLLPQKGEINARESRQSLEIATQMHAQVLM